MAYMKITIPYTGIHALYYCNVYQNSSCYLCSDCLRFCFLKLLQAELDKIAVEWNYHVIHRSSMAECPGGIPNQLYFIPQLQGIVHTAIVRHGHEPIDSSTDKVGFGMKYIIYLDACTTVKTATETPELKLTAMVFSSSFHSTDTGNNRIMMKEEVEPESTPLPLFINLCHHNIIIIFDYRI